MQTGTTDFINKNELDKACFQHDITYGKSKDLLKRTQSDEVLKDKAFKIARFIRTLKNKIFKRIAAFSKNVYFNVLDDVVNKYYYTIHRTIKMKPIEVTDDCYAKDPSIKPNKKDPKFSVGDNVRISKYKSIFAKGYIPNWSGETFVFNKIKNTVPWTCAISDLNGEEITGSFYEKELQKTNQKELRIEKIFKRKGDKLYVKWKGYDNRFNSWINKRELP